MLISNIRFAFSRHFLEVLGTKFAAFLSNHPYHTDTKQCKSVDQFLHNTSPETYLQADHDIIYNKKHKRQGGSETANRFQTNASITKDNDWNP